MSKEPKRNVYVGHRYVPLIMDEWDNTISYEGLSIVTYQGASYTSKKRVPVGIDILNEEYWVVTGNYNAQVEQYRQDVRNLENEVETGFTNIDNTITSLENDINNEFDNIKKEVSEITINLNRYTSLVNNNNWTDVINNVIDENDNPTILIPNGIIKVDDLILKNNTVIKGDSGSKILLGKDIYINSLKNITFENVIFEGQEEITELNDFFNIEESNYINFINCLIDGKNGSFTSGINVFNSSNVVIDNNEIKNLRSNKGVSFIGCTNSIISNNKIVDTGRSGISLSHSNKNIKIINNYLSNNKSNFEVADGSIDLYGVASSGKINQFIDIIGNFIENAGGIDSSSMLIRLKDSHYVTIKDNKMIASNFTNRMIYVDFRGGLNSDHLTIQNNHFFIPENTKCYNVLDVNDHIVGLEISNNDILSHGTIESAVISFRVSVDNVNIIDNVIDIKNQTSRLLYFNDEKLESEEFYNNVLVKDNILKGSHQIEFRKVRQLHFTKNIIDTLTYDFSAIALVDCFFYIVGENIITGFKPSTSYSGGSGSSGYIRLDNLTNNTSED